MFDKNLNLPVVYNLQRLPDNYIVCTLANGEPMVLQEGDVFITDGNTFKMTDDKTFIQVG